jgi:hypothetical protein
VDSKRSEDQNHFPATQKISLDGAQKVADLLSRHDAALIELNNAGKSLFENVARGSFIREVFATVT